MHTPVPPILLVEDDEVDAMTVKRALRTIEVDNPLVHAEHGEAALAYLEATGNPPPCIILLDLNMPVMNGLEFLQHVKHHPHLRRIPVVVLSTSEEQQDRDASFDLGAAGFLPKCRDYSRFIDIMRTWDQYWTCSDLPV
ncbi:response regulator [Pseudoduganella eburnea]|uniref:Response regulator n=1 Tax=Massilia eburnea TaxID=1776165 RepID=A0A6L6QD57_9BURK|nr:response regulator [Massilia eburnea]MTW10021.1 response regulator [Massilia eburnea]